MKWEGEDQGEIPFSFPSTAKQIKQINEAYCFHPFTYPYRQEPIDYEYKLDSSTFDDQIKSALRNADAFTLHCRSLFLLDCSPSSGWCQLELSWIRTWCLERSGSGMWWTVSITDRHHDRLHRLPTIFHVQSLIELRRDAELYTGERWTRYQCKIGQWHTVSFGVDRWRFEWDVQVRQCSSSLGWKLRVGKWTWSVGSCSIMSTVLSEHSFFDLSFRNGQKYAGEIHFVHQNTETGKYAVLGFFMQSHSSSNSSGSSPHRKRRKRDTSTTSEATMNEWTNYFSIASGVDANMTGSINMNLTALMGGNVNNFWRYSGSLTVPACSEGVIWSVFTIPIQFNDSLIASFRSKVLDRSFREPQPLNGRIVYRNFPNEATSRSAADACCVNVIKDTTTAGIGKANTLSSFVFLLFLCPLISLIM